MKKGISTTGLSSRVLSWGAAASEGFQRVFNFEAAGFSEIQGNYRISDSCSRNYLGHHGPVPTFSVNKSDSGKALAPKPRHVDDETPTENIRHFTRLA